MDYFTPMGIQIWKPRQFLPGAKQGCDYQLFQLLESGKEVGVLLLANKYLPGLTSKSESLLDAMLTAIGLKRAGFKGARQQKQVLLMGLELARVLVPNFSGSVMEYDNISFAATYHPLDLLQQPSYKRQAWSDLQLIAKKWQLTPLKIAKEAS